MTSMYLILKEETLEGYCVAWIVGEKNPQIRETSILFEDSPCLSILLQSIPIRYL